MGNWVTISSAGSSGYTPPPDAPNVTSVSASAFYTMLGNASVAGVQGTITLPTGDAAYSHLKEIEITGTLPDGSKYVGGSLFAPFVGSTVTFKGPAVIQQTGSDQSVAMKYRVKNDAGIATGSPVTGTVTVQASKVTSASAAEAGSLEADGNRVVYTYVDTVPVLQGSQVPQNVTLYVSEDGGSYYTYIGWFLISSVGQAIRIRRPKPGTGATWKTYSVAGPIGGDPARKIPAAELPAGGAIASFSMTGLAAPGSAVVTSISAGTITAHEDESTHWQWAELDGVNWTDPTSDPNSWLVKFYIRETNAAGTAAPDAKGTWREWFERQVTGGARTSIGSGIGPLQITYRPAGDAYHYLEIQCVAVNRLSNNPTDWNGSNTGSSVAQGSVIRLDFGALPAGAIPADRIDPDTWGPGIYQGLDGKPKTGTSANPSNMLSNADFEDGDAGWTRLLGTEVGPEATAGFAYTGTKYWRTDSSLGTGAGVQQGPFTCRPGDTFFAEAYVRALLMTGTARILLHYQDAAGGSDVFEYADVALTSGMAWTKLAVTGTVPAGLCKVTVIVGLQVYTSGSGWWYIDHVSLRPQVSTGAGMAPDGAGGVKAYDLDVSVFASTVRPIPIFSANPTLPDANYPLGTLGFNTSTKALMRVNAAGNGWIKAIDGGTDILANSITVNEINVGSLSASFATISYLTANYITASSISASYATIAALNAKTITANNITAGTCSASVSFTAPTLVITSGSVTINIDGSNYMKVTDTSFTRFTKQSATAFRLESTADSFRYVQMILDKVEVSGSSGTSSSALTPGTILINGTQVMGPRLVTRPVTLADVINAGVTHGWWS